MNWIHPFVPIGFILFAFSIKMFDMWIQCNKVRPGTCSSPFMLILPILFFVCGLLFMSPWGDILESQTHIEQKATEEVKK